MNTEKKDWLKAYVRRNDLFDNFQLKLALKNDCVVKNDFQLFKQ